MAEIRHRPFEGYRIAILETRQAAELGGLLERRGATVERCALIGIKPTPDPGPVDEWLTRFIEDKGLQDLVILTGEALRKLHDRAETIGLDTAFRQRLSEVNLLTRGPKPGRVLRQWGMTETVRSDVPTTDGVIAALHSRGISSNAVGIALYGTEPNRRLQEAVRELNAEPVPVWPYVYTDHNDEVGARALVERMTAGEVNAVIFSTKRQVDVLLEIAREQELEGSLRDAFESMTIAAMGPVVGEKLSALNITVDAAPPERYFMRPLVDALARSLPEH